MKYVDQTYLLKTLQTSAIVVVVDFNVMFDISLHIGVCLCLCQSTETNNHYSVWIKHINFSISHIQRHFTFAYGYHLINLIVNTIEVGISKRAHPHKYMRCVCSV